MAAKKILLKKFQLKGITDSKEEIGKGAFCTVTKLYFKGMRCAGKKIHDFFIEQLNETDKDGMLKRFCEECELLSNLRHPNIIQFLGVYEREQGIPILVMEYMDMSLSGLIDKHGPLPSDLAIPILKDISFGLAYIHGHDPAIVHRDLSANNVLLSENFKAKISDLGVARIMNISPDDATMVTQCPGTPVYMPPEALHDRPSYDIRIDCFSYGVLIIHMLSGQWPIPSRPTCINSVTSALEAISEFERRRKYIATIQPHLPILGLAKKCLENDPSKRPLMDEVIKTLESHSSDTDGRKALSLQSSSHKNDIAVVSLTKQLDGVQRKLASAENQIEEMVLSQSLLEVQLDTKQKEYTHLRDMTSSYIASIDNQEHCISTLNEHITRVNTLFLGSNRLPPFKIEWQKCANLPEAISSPQIVTFSEKIFVGGGHSESITAKRSLYVSKDLQEWELFYDLPVTGFGLGKLLTRLLIVSGRAVGTGGIVNTYSTLRVYDQEFLTDPCRIQRAYCSTTTIPSQCIIVVGGMNSRNEIMDSCVYLKFNKSIGDWEPLPRLPKPLYLATCLYGNGIVYVAGGYSCAEPRKANKDVFCLDWSTKQWSKLCTAPYTYSCYTLFAGTLVAINGCNDRGEETKDILMFSRLSKSFLKIGEFPEPTLASSGCCLATGEMMIVGGSRKDKQKLSCVYRGWIQL